MAEKGKFITLEGLDGCGKSTQARLLAGYLRECGVEFVLTREPGGTGVGRRISDLVQNSATERLEPLAELALMFAARAQHLEEVIRPALGAGRNVVCDRYGDSTVAYQGYGRGAGLEGIRDLDRILCDGERPDLTLVLDVDPETGARRTAERNRGSKQEKTRFEQEGPDFFQRVREGYLAIAAAEPGRVKLIDARGSVDDVQQRIRREVDALLKRKRQEAPDGI